jgi:hypothetical protein
MRSDSWILSCFSLRVKDLVWRIHSNDQVGFEPEKNVSAMRLEFSTINSLKFGWFMLQQSVRMLLNFRPCSRNRLDLHALFAVFSNGSVATWFCCVCVCFVERSKRAQPEFPMSLKHYGQKTCVDHGNLHQYFLICRIKKKMQYPEPEFIVNKTWHILGRWSCKALDIFVLVDKFTCFVTNAPNIKKRTSVALLNEYPCSSICSYCGSWTCNEARILLDLCRTVFIHWFVDKFAHWFIDS